MQHTRNLEKIYKGLSRSEKAQLLQWAARDLGDSFPGIESNPLVCGGEPCIVRTRIPIWLLAQARRLGTSEADLLLSYPTLRAEDLANAWAFERSHRKEIDAQIKANEEAYLKTLPNSLSLFSKDFMNERIQPPTQNRDDMSS